MWWPFSKKTSLAKCGFFNGFTDWHCHILPGVDDGVKSLPDALKILRLYEELGVSAVWLTPHIMEDVPNSTADLKAAFENLKANYSGKIELHLAAEYMLDSLFMERLDARDILPLGNEKQAVLVETSFWTKSSLLNDMLKRTLSTGYYPVLAHPERYSYMTESDYNQLLAMGVKFQLNLPSLTGLYGPKAQKAANMLLKKNAYSYIGSDLHSRGQLERVLESEIKENDAARVMEIKR